MAQSQTASERAVEDVLAQLPEVLENVLPNIDPPLRLVERQQQLPSGRADLVFLAGEEVLLIELKVVEATEDHVSQLKGYKEDYDAVADNTEFAEGRTLYPVLLAPSIPSSVRTACRQSDLEAVTYEIGDVLDAFHDTIFSDLRQFQVKGDVTAVARFGLFNEYLRFLEDRDDPVSITDAASEYDRLGKGNSSSPRSRIRKFVQQADALGLTTEDSDGIYLTPRGEAYVAGGDEVESRWELTTEQAQVITDLLYDNVFFSDLTYSMAALLQSVFELSKNSHPVARDDIDDWYAKKVGKGSAWGERTRADAVRWVGNYLQELGLVTVVDGAFYITPEGYDVLAHVAIDEGKSLIRSTTTRNSV
ncbi:hypothetical protein [Halobaculum marinum]|uniref:Uncharacterized protein n=1 Tax=Halobaculum marinum TaxID=3031996 RepID=A0ABD5WQ20_9EURY|nr:hypothetical protein [Halobaculum sp. DT55]